MESKALSGPQFMESVCHYSLSEMRKRQFLEKNMRIESDMIPNAVKELGQLCTSRYGFLTNVSTDITLAQSEIAIPNVFDSAFIVSVLHTSGLGVSESIKHTIRELLLENRDKDGLWCYFHSDFKILPSDLDTSCVALLALHACGMNNTTVLDMASQIYQSAIFHEDGLPDAYMLKERKPAENGITSSTSVPRDLWKPTRRVDVGIVTTFLYMLNKMGIDHLPALAPCYTFLQNVLHEVVEKNNDNILLSYAKYYYNIELLCYFTSRLIPESKHAEFLLQDLLVSLVQRRLRITGDNPISPACLILAVMNCQMYPNNVDKQLFEEQLHNLQGMQNKENHLFPKYGLYNAHQGAYHFGSEAITTSLASAAITEALKVMKA